MQMINPDSLAATLDAVNEALFYGRPLSKSQRVQVARWIAARQGLPRSYAGMFAPTESDFKEGVRLFTGERVRSGVGTAHILGEEACRTLLLLGVHEDKVSNALQRATLGITSRLAGSRPSGMYCCGTCSCALWRHLSAGGLEGPERQLNAAMAALKSHRDGRGRWRVFPFHYALLALSDIDLPSAVEEMRYVAPVCEKLVKRRAGDDEYSRRRLHLAGRILEKC